MSGSLETKWERDRDSFETLSRTEFDRLTREKQFLNGPLIGVPSPWMREFGPYNPERIAFGKLTDGRFVCCDVATETAEGE